MKREKHNGKIVVKISILWVFIIAIVFISLIAFFKNYIFATNGTNNRKNAKEEKQTDTISVAEKNQNAVDILELMVENNYSNKKLINEERKIEFTTTKENNDKLPKGEEEVKQKGENGTKQVTALQVYQENEMVGEELIEEIITKEPVTEIIYVGTSEFLSKYNVHIGEEMYLIEAGEIRESAKEDAEIVYELNRYLNVKLEDFDDTWAKIKYKDYEGYIEISKLTSETVTPKILEKNRIAKLQAELSIDMDLSKPSGLTLSDYKTIFKYNTSDKNGIFADNVEVFYNAEQKYQINGIFLAAIGIHESAWGTSTIAKEKYNLFGYRAYDRDPLNSAMSFESYEECINTVAEALQTNYLTETGAYYNGTTVKDVNVRYASDTGWAEKVYAYMEYLYDKLG